MKANNSKIRAKQRRRFSIRYRFVMRIPVRWVEKKTPRKMLAQKRQP